MKRITFIAIALFLILCSSSFGWDQTNFDLKLKMSTVSKAGPPELFFRTILFTFDDYKYARYVGIAFEHEDFQQIHPFKRNEMDVFILPFDPPDNITALHYRIIVDGLWMPDPNNMQFTTDTRGNKLSRIHLSLPAKRVYVSPTVSVNGDVEFTFRHSEGKRVFLTGSFTNWEPFMIEMNETSPGVYEFKRNMKPGYYEYCFIANGRRVIDPLNADFGTNSHGYLASRFAIR
jgi:hypothetical protein